jgi:hypothetical protein
LRIVATAEGLLLDDTGLSINEGQQQNGSFVADCVCCTPEKWFCVYVSTNPAQGSSCVREKDVVDPTLIVSGPHANEAACVASGCGGSFSYYCKEETSTCEPCCPWWLVGAGCDPTVVPYCPPFQASYPSWSACQDECNTAGACCQTTYTPCEPGSCENCDSYWTLNRGVPELVQPDPDVTLLVTDGCGVYAGSPSSPPFCTGDPVGWATKELAVGKGSIITGGCFNSATKSACDAVGGTWIAGKKCSEAPCPGDCYGSGNPTQCSGDGPDPADGCQGNIFCSPAITSATVAIQGAELFKNGDGTPVSPELQPLVDAVNRAFVLRPRVPGSCQLDEVNVPVEIDGFPGSPFGVLVRLFLNDDGVSYCRLLEVIVRPSLSGIGNSGSSTPERICTPLEKTYLSDCSCFLYYKCRGNYSTPMTGAGGGGFVNFGTATVSVTIA